MTTPALGIWLDDPPRLTLSKPYLAALKALPIREVAVMLDGPEPGLEDARWTARDLQRLRDALPYHRRVLTAWASADARAIQQLGRELPELLDALEAVSLELDVEPVGEWRERDVHGFADRDLDGARLDDVAEALAAMMLSLPVREFETTTFPGALAAVLPLLDELARQAPSDVAIRLWLQLYAVLTRGERKVSWTGKLGPMRFPREGLELARRRVPGRVEVCAGLAAYDTRWPGRGDSMVVAAEAALLGGSSSLRWWSAKWLCRLAGNKARRAQVERVAAELKARDTQPAPAPTMLEEARDEVLDVAQRIKSAHPEKAEDLAVAAEKLLR